MIIEHKDATPIEEKSKHPLYVLEVNLYYKSKAYSGEVNYHFDDKLDVGSLESVLNMCNEPRKEYLSLKRLVECTVDGYIRENN
ncbi:hypothetical protein [Ferdinandcohnia sp. SAFN-114]|uniref:hypothetical protein n=1 Tax=Ferdinandcohnia sp. SAFN-114 TaxID=3387275 RepID=UPI003F7F6CE3